MGWLMKRIPILISVLLLSLLMSAVPVFADEEIETSDKIEQQKDECLLLAKRCGTTVYSIQDKIEKLKEEIAKGTKVYTLEELNSLKQKLEDVSRTLDFLMGQ
jgi:hypothetical protein